MPRFTAIKNVHVDLMPDILEEGILYISSKYLCSKHKCFCGCGEVVVLDLTRWLHLKADTMSYAPVSVTPSVGSFNLPCKSHYFITYDTVEWL